MSSFNDLELLARSYADQVQELNDAATDLLVKVSLDAATGVQLDGLGDIIGLDRQGLGDEAYRSALKGWIRVNTSGGTVEQLNEVIRLVTSSTAADKAFSLVEYFPAGFLIVYTEALDADVGYLAAEAMYQAKAAGVYGIFEFHATEPVFAFDGANGGSKFDGGHYFKTAIRNRAGRESEIL
jgi:hypothetical protein